MNYLLKMSQKQDSLNEHTKKGWRNKGLNFRRALRLEAAEAMESTPWKWWKKGEMNNENLVVEATDMMHFALSIALMEGYEGWVWLDDQVEKIMIDPLRLSEEAVVESVQDQIDDIMQRTFYTDTANSNPSDIVRSVVILMWLLNMSRDDMYKMYFAKNVLNEFRQDNGYESGSYIKIWDGSEDNVFMQGFVKNVGISDHFDHELYSGLKEKYEEVKEGVK